LRKDRGRLLVTHEFAVSVDWDDHGRVIGNVPALDDCIAVGADMDEMLELLEEEVRSQLAARGRLGADDDIELVGFDLWTI